MGKEKKTVMGKNAKIIIFSLVGLGVLGGVAALLMLTAPQPEEIPVTQAELDAMKELEEQAQHAAEQTTGGES